MTGSFLAYPKYLAPTNSEDKAEDNFEVLADNQDLMLIAKRLSEKLRHPVTIIDANRIGTGEKSGEIRVNSEAEFFSLRNSCKLFRYFAGDDICYACDHEHAKKFMEQIKLEAHEKDPDFSNREEDYYIRKQENKNALGFFYVRDFKRLLYEYRCPMLGYRELLIPIFFPPRGVDPDNNILGILIIGQSVIEAENDADYIENVKKSYFSDNNSHDLFNMDSYSDSIKEMIIDIDNKLSPFEKLLRLQSKCNKEYSEATTMSFSDIDSYIKFIRDACGYLRNIEDELYDLCVEKRKSYFKKISSFVVNKFFDNMKNLEDENKYKEREPYFKLQTAWNQLLSATGKLKRYFGIDAIHVFGDGTALAMTENQKKPLYSPDSRKINNWYYDFSVVDSLGMQNIQFASSLGNPRRKEKPKYCQKILDSLNADGINKKNCFIILFSDIALVFCVKELKNNESVYSDLAFEIGNQFSRIHSSIGLLTADFMQKKQVMILRMNRHENAHIAERLNDHLDWTFSENGRTFSNLDEQKKIFVIDDLKDASRLLSNMADNIGIIVGSITKENIRNKVENVNIDLMLNKWRKMFRDKLIERNLFMTINRSLWAQNEIKTVPTLFELMIYNLVDNAVKYAYRGTNIYLRWDKTTEGSVFTAVNYGSQIIDTERIFDLYVRGSNAEKDQKIEGDGIGLYSVKRICELLGCEIDSSSDLVAEYNLPLIDWYTKMFGPWESAELFDYNQDFDNHIRNEIVNIDGIPKEKVTKMYLQKRIKNKIYKTVFTVKVPNTFKGDN